MTNFIPIFPLDLIVYPDQSLKLHIFEPRYRQLINECIEEQKTFGIPLLQQGKISEYGTLAEVTEVISRDEDGSMNIKVKGIQVFRILEVIKELPEKHYAGAIVNYPENDKMKVHPNLSRLIFNEVVRLYRFLNIENSLPARLKEWTSYDIAHKVGLTREQEYELLCIFNEVQRMEYLRRHFNTIMSAMDDVELLKSRISLN
jgi:Lon protease-like protein